MGESNLPPQNPVRVPGPPPLPVQPLPPLPPPGQTGYPLPPPRPRNPLIWIIPLVAGGALLFMLALAISILLPALNAARERANRVKCASNLRQIGQGLLLYANDNRTYPRVRYDSSKDPTAFTPDARGGIAPNETDPFYGPNRPADNDVTAALFLLVRETGLAPDVFVCPSTSQEKDTLNNASALQRVNFNSNINLSYSYANPYPRPNGISIGYSLGPNAVATFAIAADRNDGNLDANLAATSASPPQIQRDMNSRNHRQDGQNVLFNDGHVEWASTCWAGDDDDCIWGDAASIQPGPPPSQSTPARTSNGTDPKLELDSILLPKRGYGLP